MYLFDASSMIYAWDNYPIDNFPPVWDWVKTEIKNNFFQVPQIAYEEINQKDPNCAGWLKKTGLNCIKMTNVNDILERTIEIKNKLGINNDAYGGGVGENDILIIAIAKTHGLILVTEEKKQLILPTEKKNYKIPAVCAMTKIECISFIDLIKKSNKKFIN